MRLLELLSPADFWNDAKHAVLPGLAQKIETMFAGKTFRSEADARATILATLKIAHASTLIPNDLSNERAIASAAPVYHDGAAWRIGTKNVQPKITWKEIEVRSEGRRAIAVSADASAAEWECDWKVHYVPCKDILPPKEQDDYLSDPVEWKRIQAIAAAIQENGWFTAVFVGDQEDEDGRASRYVIEGQHRTRAVAYILGLPTVAAHLIEIFD